MTDKRDLWTVQQLAAASGLTGARIRQILAEGEKLRGIKLGKGRGGQWAVIDSEARRWLESRTGKE